MLQIDHRFQQIWQEAWQTLGETSPSYHLQIKFRTLWHVNCVVCTCWKINFILFKRWSSEIETYITKYKRHHITSFLRDYLYYLTKKIKSITPRKRPENYSEQRINTTAKLSQNWQESNSIWITSRLGIVPNVYMTLYKIHNLVVKSYTCIVCKTYLCVQLSQ